MMCTCENITCEKRLCNLKDPRIHVNATDKKYVDGKIQGDLQHTTAYNYKKAISTFHDKHIKIYQNLLHKTEKVRHPNFYELMKKIKGTYNICMKAICKFNIPG